MSIAHKSRWIILLLLIGLGLGCISSSAGAMTLHEVYEHMRGLQDPEFLNALGKGLVLTEDDILSLSSILLSRYRRYHVQDKTSFTPADAIQMVMLKVWKYAQNHEIKPDSFVKLLNTCFTNMISEISARHPRREYPESGLEAPLDLLARSEHDPSAKMEEIELKTMVERAIHTIVDQTHIPTSQKVGFLRNIIAGYGPKEAATLNDIHLGKSSLSELFTRMMGLSYAQFSELSMQEQLKHILHRANTAPTTVGIKDITAGLCRG